MRRGGHSASSSRIGSAPAIASTSAPTPRRARPRRCARRWPRPRSATSSAATTRRCARSRSGWPSCSATRRRSSCPRDDVQRDRHPAAHPARRRRAVPRPRHPPADRRGGRARRRSPARSSRSSTATAGMFAAGRARRGDPRPSGPATATRPRPRLVCVEQTTNMGGGRVWPLRAGARRARGRPRRTGCARTSTARGCMNAVVASGVDGRRLGGRLRHRLAGLHQGPRRPGRRVPGRLGGAHRRGVALEADARRRDAPGGIVAAAGLLRARPPRRAPGRRPRARARAWPTGSPSSPASSSTRRRWRPTSSSSRSPDAAALLRARSHADGRRDEPLRRRTRVRAVTHLDVDDDGHRARAGRPRALGARARSLAAHERRTAYRTCPLCEATCGLRDHRRRTARSPASAATPTTSSATASSAPRAPALKRAARRPRPPAHAARARRPAATCEPASWDEAFAEIDRRLPPILAEHGRDAVAAYLGNPSAHNLGALLYGRVLLKALRHAQHLLSASTVDQMPKQMAAALMFGSGADGRRCPTSTAPTTC